MNVEVWTMIILWHLAWIALGAMFGRWITFKHYEGLLNVDIEKLEESKEKQDKRISFEVALQEISGCDECTVCQRLAKERLGIT